MKLPKSQLFKLKKWITVPEAAGYLTTLLEETVGEADVLRLALDNHLVLSVNLVNGASARFGNIVTFDEREIAYYPKDIASPIKIHHVKRSDTGLPGDVLENIKKGLVHAVVTGIVMDAPDVDPPGQVLELSEEISSIRGVFDLPMLGAERLDVEHYYQQLTSGLEVTGVVLDGTFVRSSDGQLAQLQERFDSPKMREISEELKKNNPKIAAQQPKKESPLPYGDPRNYFPAGGLESVDHVFVVRTSALTDFLMRISDPASDAPVGKKERDSLLTIIEALAKLAKIDLDRPSASAETIAAQAAQLGQTITSRAIATHLSKLKSR